MHIFIFEFCRNYAHFYFLLDTTKDDQVLLRFLFSRVLFSEYAHAAESDEVFQPKLASLHVLSFLKEDIDRERLREDVFAGLKEIARRGKENLIDLIDLPWHPTFLPYLLSRNPKSPQDLLEQAIQLRKDPAVREYAGWFQTLEQDLDYMREPNHALIRELEGIRRAIERRLAVPNEEPTTVKLHIAAVDPSVDVERRIYPSQIWGWFSGLLPGNRYRKLLLEMVDAERRYRRLDTQLRKLWYHVG